MSDDSIHYSHQDKHGMWSLRDHPINPTTQAEADVIYNDLGLYLSDERVHADGENSESMARDHFNTYMRKAMEVERCGFLPSECSDVWEAGQSPKAIGLWT